MSFVQLARKRLLSSIAALVMLFNVCAPALSHVVLPASSGQDFLVEVCTTTGTKFIKLDTADSESTNHASDRSLPDCAHCALSVYFADRPPEHTLSQLASLPEIPSPHQESTLPNAQARWTVNAPRAPPISL
jgi:hypothetical protein